MRLLAAVALVLGSAAAAAIAPVWTYAISLALFGLPHVLVELRYVDERFAARMPRNLILGLGIGLAGIVLMRAFGLLGAGSSDERITLELVLGVSLIAVAFPLLRRAKTSPLAIAVGGGLLFGIAYAPIATLVTMALLHNLTPIGFLAERLQGAERRRAMALCAIARRFAPERAGAGPKDSWQDFPGYHSASASILPSSSRTAFLPGCPPPA